MYYKYIYIINNILFLFWCLSSLGTPFIASYYVQYLEIAYANIKPIPDGKFPKLLNITSGKIIQPNCEFEKMYWIRIILFIVLHWVHLQYLHLLNI